MEKKEIMKNIKLAITLIASALTLTQAGYAAEEAAQQSMQPDVQIQAEVPAQALAAEQASTNAPTPKLTPEQLQTLEKVKALASVLNPKLVILEQKAKDLLDTINKLEPGKDIPADKVSEYFQGLKAELKQYFINNIMNDLQALQELPRLPNSIGEDLIFINKLYRTTKYKERADLAARWKEEESLGIDKNLIFDDSIFYAARTQPTRIPLGENFAIRLRRHCQGCTGDFLYTPVVSPGTVEAINDSYISDDSTTPMAGEKGYLPGYDSAVGLHNFGVGGTRIFNFKAIQKGYATVFIPEGDFRPRSRTPEGLVAIEASAEHEMPNAPVKGYFAQFMIEEPQTATPEQKTESKEMAPAPEQAANN